MSDPGLSTSDWINIAVAIGVAATAVFTAQTARAARQQARLYAPVVNFSVTKAKVHPLWRLTVTVIPADSDRFMIVRMTVPWLGRARLIKGEDRHGARGMEFQPSGPPARAVPFSAAWVRPSVLVDPRGAEEAVVHVHIASRADSKVRSRRTIRISMKD